MNIEQNNILIIDNSVAVTGALNASLNACSNLKHEFKFIYILPDKSTAKKSVLDEGFALYTLPLIEISKRPKDLLLYIPYLLINAIRLKRIVKRHHIKIIHMNDFYNLTGIITKVLGAKIYLVTHVRFMPQRFAPALSKLWSTLNLKFADAIICVSQAVRSYFDDSPKLRVISDPVPLSEKHPSKIVLIQKEEVKLLYLSNFIPGKGHDYALLAFAKAYASNRNLRLLFAGGDMGMEKNRRFRQTLEEQVFKLNLREVVSFEDFVLDVENKIKEADIILNFSESESFSLTCLDALFYGTPLIASDCGGPAELFENGKSGFLVPNRNVDAMADAIARLAKDSMLQRVFSEEGKRFVRNKFKSENTYLSLGDIYKRLMKE